MTNEPKVRVRGARTLFTGMAAALALFASAPAFAQASPNEVAAAIDDAGGPKEVRAFYDARGHRPLWIRDGAIGPEAERLLMLIRSAEVDGLDPDDYRPRALASAIERAAEDGSPKALARAELMLSRSFAQLARDMRRPGKAARANIVYADRELEPETPTMRAILDQAGAAPSLATHMKSMGWMHPIYARLREAATAGDDAGPEAWRVVRLNLDRARMLPAATSGRHVVVDAAAARLWMYEGGKVAGTMRVVVGKPDEQTPMMAALIRYASVNPYWNIPPDLVRIRVAPGAQSQGPSFLKAKRFEALSGWDAGARVVDPAMIDWAAVEAGQVDARVRQLPGPNNAMGRIKFMFPNDLGIYLHDTPERALLKEDERLFSSGCVRVEDAPRLARWLFGKPVSLRTRTPEKRVDLPAPVPVHITYLTAAADGKGLVFRPDVYGRDGGARRDSALASR